MRVVGIVSLFGLHQFSICFFTRSMSPPRWVNAVYLLGEAGDRNLEAGRVCRHDGVRIGEQVEIGAQVTRDICILHNAYQFRKSGMQQGFGPVEQVDARNKALGCSFPDDPRKQFRLHETMGQPIVLDVPLRTAGAAQIAGAGHINVEIEFLRLHQSNSALPPVAEGFSVDCLQ